MNRCDKIRQSVERFGCFDTLSPSLGGIDYRTVPGYVEQRCAEICRDFGGPVEEADSPFAAPVVRSRMSDDERRARNSERMKAKRG